MAHGFAIVRNDQGPQGYSIRVFVLGALAVQIFSERGLWDLVVSNEAEAVLTGKWFHIEDVMAFLNRGVGDHLTFKQSIEVLVSNLGAVQTLFASDDFENIATKLKRLWLMRQDRVNMWPPAIMNFQSFLTSIGFTCMVWIEPDTVSPKRRMSFKTETLSVEIQCNMGWMLRIGTSLRPMSERHDVRFIRMLLTGSDYGLRFYDWFVFAENHWREIVELFAPERIEETKKALAALHRKVKGPR